MAYFVIKVSEADRDRVNALAAKLTADGPGRFGQSETIRHLLDCYEAAVETFGQRAVDIAREGSQ